VDLMRRGALDELADAAQVIYMAARKFGTAENNSATWATNAFLPGLVAQRYADSRIVAFSTGNVYPLVRVQAGGCTEETPLDPVGEYGQSALARERVLEAFSRANGTRVALLRLNYAVELRYGVLADIAGKIWRGEPVDLAMGYVNVIWQGDANSVCLRSFGLCASPPAALNLTGPETLRVRTIAEGFGRLLGVEPRFHGSEASTALLSDASASVARFGAPRVGVEQVMEWVAEWVRQGGRSLGKPTHFETRDGKF
jgi:nucleoside-diphosphate-sugar epimerase